MTDDLLSRLARLDAAPHDELAAVDLDRKEQLLRTVLADTGRPGRLVGAAPGRPLVRRRVLMVAGAVAAGAAVVMLAGRLSGSGAAGPLSSADLASWTSTPNTLPTGGASSAAVKWCLDDAKGFPGAGATPRISNADIRGKVASMVITQGNDALYCLAGPDGTGMAMGMPPTATVPAGRITIETTGSRGRGAAEFNYALGSAGPDVTKITLHDHGHVVHATLDHGRWTAWWPNGNPDGLLSGNVVLTLTDGTTRTIHSKSLMRW